MRGTSGPLPYVRNDGTGEIIPSMENAIFFSSKSESHRFLSNFSPSPFMLDGEQWPTVEHYYQAQKFVGHDNYRAIRQANSPSMAKRLGQNKDTPIPENWDQARINVMREALLAKFSQNPQLKQALINTGHKLLIEDTGDPFWGRGGKKGLGSNKLGALLMELRETFATPDEIVSFGESANQFRTPLISSPRPSFPEKVRFGEQSTLNVPIFFTDVVKVFFDQIIPNEQSELLSHLHKFLDETISQVQHEVHDSTVDPESRSGPDHARIQARKNDSDLTIFYKFSILPESNTPMVRFSITRRSNDNDSLFVSTVINTNPKENTAISVAARHNTNQIVAFCERIPDSQLLNTASGNTNIQDLSILEHLHPTLRCLVPLVNGE